METGNAILQQSQFLRHEDASDCDLKVLQDWLTHPGGGDFFLRGREKDTWKCENDLMSLAGKQSGTDPLTLWIYDRVVPWFHNRWGHRVKVCSINSGSLFGTTDDATFSCSSPIRNQGFVSTMIKRYSWERAWLARCSLRCYRLYQYSFYI